MPTVNTTKLVNILSKDLSYNPQGKAEFHKEAKKVLKAVADKLGLSKGEFDLRSNVGGIAGSGEVTLHTDRLYLTLSQGVCGNSTNQMYRACNGRKDSRGGTNQWIDVSRLLDDAVIARFEKIQDSQTA